jgi:hypothetical protein
MTDPLKREVPPHEVPLQSPMPRSPILDRDQPEQAYEEDIPSDDDPADPADPAQPSREPRRPT